MNEADLVLERLLRSARLAQPPVPTEVPYALESRILNAWRRGLEPDRPAPVLPILRRAFLCACAILVFSTVLALSSLRESPPAPDELTVVDSAIQLTLLP